MSLTRKHFIELAEIFRSLAPDGNSTPPADLMWDHLRERIAEFCAKHNSQFDYERFMKASVEDE